MGQKPFIFMPSQSLDFIVSNIDDFLKDNPNEKATVMLLESSKALKEIFENRKIRGYTFSYVQKNEDFGVFNIYKKDAKIENIIIKIPNSNLFLFLNFDNLKVMRWISSFFLRLYSDFSKLAFTSDELKSLLMNIKGEITSRKVIYKKIVRTPDKEKVNFGKETEIIYTNEDFLKSFESALKDNKFIDKIDLELKREHSTIKSYFSREGIFRFSGCFSIFLKSLINEQIKKLGSKKIDFLEKHIAKKFDGSIKSFKIKFGYPIFEKLGKNKEFISSIKSMKNTMLVVYHGNPYLHLSILDYFDGSSYDLITIEKDSIIVNSKERSSFSSINRLVNYIFENFAEGEITNG